MLLQDRAHTTGSLKSFRRIGLPSLQNPVCHKKKVIYLISLSHQLDFCKKCERSRLCREVLHDMIFRMRSKLQIWEGNFRENQKVPNNGQKITNMTFQGALTICIKTSPH